MMHKSLKQNPNPKKEERKNNTEPNVKQAVSYARYGFFFEQGQGAKPRCRFRNPFITVSDLFWPLNFNAKMRLVIFMQGFSRHKLAVRIIPIPPCTMIT